MAATRRPLIGVTGPDGGGTAAWLATAFAVWRAGGRALRITPARPRALHHVDALIIGGGADVAPELYGEQDEAELDDAVKRSSTRWTRRPLWRARRSPRCCPASRSRSRRTAASRAYSVARRCT